MVPVLRVGERVRVRTEDKAIKVWGRVVDVIVHTNQVDVTRSGMFGGPVDSHRVTVPGPTSVQVVIEIEP